ncbi:AI-2E family transporter [Cytophagaceae bacterium ABcell3]|nr:AI-2E family transporter [Cytophagaceae bacterium ABcell3]
MKTPFYVKWVMILIGLVALFFILFIGRTVIIPVFIALLFAFLMLPFAEWMEQKGLSRGAASFHATLSMIFIILGFFLFLLWQMDRLTEEVTQLEQEVDKFTFQLQQMIHDRFDITPEEQREFLEEHGTGDEVGGFMQGVATAVSDLVVASILIPMSMFFMLFYRSYYMEFLYRANPKERHEDIRRIIRNEKKIVFQYITGIFTVVLILAVSNVSFLSAIGLDQALLFGVIAAVLNIIPIVGTFIGSILPVVYALVMEDSLWFPVGIALYFWVLQILESNIITPNIVGTKVRVNPYAIILAIFIGGEVWGPAGMVLFIPLLAILKVVCKVVEPLKPYGFLLTDPGKDEVTTFQKVYHKIKSWFRK